MIPRTIALIPFTMAYEDDERDVWLNPAAVIGLVDVSTPELTRTRIDLTTGKSVVVSEALETAACNLQGIDPPLERGGALGA